jgi:hypothetical protein
VNDLGSLMGGSKIAPTWAIISHNQPNEPPYKTNELMKK